MAQTIKCFYHFVLNIKSKHVPNFVVNSRRTFLFFLNSYCLKHCLLVYLLLLFHFSTVPLPGDCALDFSSLEPNPPGRIVPYKPVYKSVRFDESSSRYQPPPLHPSSMKRKPNRHSLKHDNSLSISQNIIRSTTSLPPQLPPEEFSFSVSPFYVESYVDGLPSSSSPHQKDHDPSREGVKTSSSRRVAAQKSSKHSTAKSVTLLGAPFEALSTYPNQFDQFGGTSIRDRSQRQVNNGHSVEQSVGKSSSSISSKPSQLISSTFDKSRLKAKAKSDYMSSDTSEKRSLFANNPLTNKSFTTHYLNSIDRSAHQLNPAPDENGVYFGFDNNDVDAIRKKERQNPSIENISENDDLFDYASQENVFLDDSSEQGALANGIVNANRFVTVDYLSHEEEKQPSFFTDSFHSPLPHSLVHSLHEDEQMKESGSFLSSRKARFVVHMAGQKTANITWPVKKVAEIPGDITLGGLMMVHEREDKQICGPIMPQGGIQALEAMLHTIDYVNSQEHFLPGIKLGAKLLDDCDKDTYGLEQSIDFIKGSITNIGEGYKCADGSDGSGTRAHKIWGVLGAASSATSIQVANLLRLFRIPQVSFFSTSSELSNKQRFEYFLRTVPSDKDQALAIVEIVKRLKWSYVSIIYEESIYGIRAFNDLEELLEQNDICIAIKERLTKDSGVAAESSYDNIVKKLATKLNAKGVIVFGSDQEVALLMRAVGRNNATGQFYWIGSDGWSARSLVFQGNEKQVEGTISVQPMANPVPGFDDYFLSLTPKNNKRNPWFIEYWEHYFQCKWPNSDNTPYNMNFTRNCSGEEQMTPDNGYEAEGQLQFVSDAVLAFAYAIKSMHGELCGKDTFGVCPRMLAADGSVLLQHLKTVTFKAIDQHEFHFAENGDGPARYRIIHYKRGDDNTFDWIQVGEYVDGLLDLDLGKVRFRANEPEAPVSVCSQPCERGQAKSFIEGEKCCFHCINCTKYQFLAEETNCADCPSGTLPDEDKSKCVPIPEEYMRPDSSWSIGAIVFSWIGILLTVFVIIIFIRYNDTPVVRASGRELCYVLLIGILMCYSMTFVLVQKPTTVICGAQKAGIGLCFSVVYSALLTKTNRINRIFKAGKKSARRPSFISPKSQLLICGAFVLIQLFVIVTWLAFSPPRVINYHPTREDNKLICQASINAGYFVAFIYPIILIVVCTVYAVLTRNIPEAFNESKFIGFTMYTTCIIWLAFVPIYFTSSQSNHIALNITTLSVSISLSATVTLLCLFTPKLYIILLHPEKNIRQSMMPQNKYSKSVVGAKTPQQQQPDQTLQGGQNAVIKVTTCIQTNRVDSATQSDEYEMSEVMVITGSGNKETTFEGRSSNLSEIASVGNGVHSRNGSLKGNINGFKCRCMIAAPTAASTDSKESNNAATATEDSAEDASASEKDTTATAVPAVSHLSSKSTAINYSNEPVKKEHKSTQTMMSIVNGGINGGIIGSTRASIDVGTAYNSEPTVDNAFPNQLSI